jgi:hypothetical protein
MALLTFCSTDLLNSYTVKLLVLHVFMELLINAVEFVVGELHFGFPVAVNAPTHAEVCKLINLIHLLDLTVTGLALLLPCIHVLGMVEIYMIRQVMDADPLDGLAFSVVLLLGRIPAGKFVQLLDLRCAIHLGSVFTVQLWTFRILIDAHVTVHTNIHRRNVGMLALLCTAMAIQTVDLVDAGMYGMRIEYGLLRLIIF